MNLAYKIKMVVIGLCSMHRGQVLDFTWAMLHPIQSYENDSAWFLELYERNMEEAWLSFGKIPSTLIYGLIALIFRKESHESN